MSGWAKIGLPAEKKPMSQWIYQPAEIKISASPSRVTGPAELIEILWVTRSLKYSISSSPSKPLCLKLFKIIFGSYLNMNIEFLGRESDLSESRSFYSGWQYIWWPNAFDCWTRSSPIAQTFSHKILWKYSTAPLQPPWKIWDPWMHFLWSKIENIDFSRSRVTNCDFGLIVSKLRNQEWSTTYHGAVSEVAKVFDVTFFFPSPGILDTCRL